MILRELRAVITTDRLGVIIAITRNPGLRWLGWRNTDAVVVVGEKLCVAITAAAPEYGVPRVEIVGRDIIILGELGAGVPTLGFAVLVAEGCYARLCR